MPFHPQNQIKCPTCHQSDQTILVEDLYFALIENDQETLLRFNIQRTHTKSLLRDIRPPSLEHLPIWFILPPDILSGIIFIVFVLLIALSGIQPGFGQKFLFPIVFLLGYLIFRHTIRNKYNKNKNEHQIEINQAQKAVERWSSYFICLNDMTVFSGHNGNSFTVSELQNHLH